MARDDLSRTRKLRSATWRFLEVYCKNERADGDLLGWCRLCGALGVSTTLFMSKGTKRNAVKHFENVSKGDGSVKQMVHDRAALYTCQNPTGATRSKRVVDGSITRFMSSDQRPHNLRFVLMLERTQSSTC